MACDFRFISVSATPVIPSSVSTCTMTVLQIVQTHHVGFDIGYLHCYLSV